jgi:hypothetical protein
MAPASLDRPASPLRYDPTNAAPSERHGRGDAGAGRAVSRLPDSCMTEPVSILRPTADATDNRLTITVGSRRMDDGELSARQNEMEALQREIDEQQE